MLWLQIKDEWNNLIAEVWDLLTNQKKAGTQEYITSDIFNPLKETQGLNTQSTKWTTGVQVNQTI